MRLGEKCAILLAQYEIVVLRAGSLDVGVKPNERNKLKGKRKGKGKNVAVSIRKDESCQPKSLDESHHFNIPLVGGAGRK
jgi:hypothetical protein